MVGEEPLSVLDKNKKFHAAIAPFYIKAVSVKDNKS